MRAPGRPARRAWSAGVVRRRSPAARWRMTRIRSGAVTRRPSPRQRPVDRAPNLPHRNPLEAVEPGAFVPVAWPAPDLLAEELMSVPRPVREPDLGDGRPRIPTVGTPSAGPREGAPVVRHQDVERAHHAPVAPQREARHDDGLRLGAAAAIRRARPSSPAPPARPFGTPPSKAREGAPRTGPRAIAWRSTGSPRGARPWERRRPSRARSRPGPASIRGRRGARARPSPPRRRDGDAVRSPSPRCRATGARGGGAPPPRGARGRPGCDGCRGAGARAAWDRRGWARPSRPPGWRSGGFRRDR